MSNILFIEPNTLLAQAYTKGLRRDGHIVNHVLGAQTGIHAADTQSPDLVILELELPGHNGVEFLHEFRSYMEWQEVPAILLTNLPPGRVGEPGDLAMQDLGIKAVLYKPKTTLQKLLRTVREQLALS